MLSLYRKRIGNAAIALQSDSVKWLRSPLKHDKVRYLVMSQVQMSTAPGCGCLNLQAPILGTALVG